jgi:transcriptional regulator with XRE-family HTH domain
VLAPGAAVHAAANTATAAMKTSDFVVESPISGASETRRMDDVRVGRAVRMMRVRRGWRQADLAVRAQVPRQVVGRIERGLLTTVTYGALRRVAEALGWRLELLVDSPGRDLDRLINAGHSAMHESFAGLIRAARGWISAPEISFSIYGERGVIDAVAFHEATGSLLVVEFKTLIVDVNDLMASMDRRRRLAPRIGRERGWNVSTVSTWVIVADTRTNRRRLAVHATVLRSAFPADGRTMRRFLASPSGSVAALSFLPIDAVTATRRRPGPVRQPRTLASARQTLPNDLRSDR